MTRSNTARRFGIKNEPNDFELKNLQILCQQVLEPARCIVGHALHINSGFRCKELNKKVGGVANSYHLAGKAADIAVSKDDDVQLLCDALNYQPLTDLVLVEHAASTWVHVQWSTKPRHIVTYNYKPQNR